MRNVLPTLIVVPVTAVLTAFVFAVIVETRRNEAEDLGLSASRGDSELRRLDADVRSLRRALADLNRRLELAIEEDEPPAYVTAETAAPASVSTLDQDGLRDLVRDIIEEEREARRAEADATRRERLHAFRSYREGPYGEFNVRVNTMAEKLDLDDAQTRQYHALLVRYDETAGALYEGIRFGSDSRGLDSGDYRTRLEQVAVEKRELDRAFDQEFISALTREQATDYEALPDDARGSGPNAGVSRLRVSWGDMENLAAAE